LHTDTEKASADSPIAIRNNSKNPIFTLSFQNKKTRGQQKLPVSLIVNPNLQLKVQTKNFTKTGICKFCLIFYALFN
jgi:hypothetical protein